MTMALPSWRPPCAKPPTAAPRASSVAFILARRHRARQRAASLPVNLSRRPDLENLAVPTSALEVYDELSDDPDTQ